MRFISGLIGIDLVGASLLVHGKEGGAWSDFIDPPNIYRPKFRYWYPDASVPSTVVQEDIANLSSVGAGGVEFVPFYLYGLPTGGPPPTDWNIYGYGTPAYTEAFRSVLQAAKDSNLLVDFAVGANQGQGSPSPPGRRGLAVHLLAGNVSIAGGDTFNGPVPPPTALSDLLTSGLGYQHELEHFGTPNLTAVIAFEIQDVTTAPFPAAGIELPAYIVAEESIIDLTDSVAAGNLSFTAPNSNSTWRIFSLWEAFTNQRSCAPSVNATDIIANGSWIVDHFSSTGAQITTDFLDQHILSHTEIRALLNEVGNYAWEDSMEMLAALWWTPGFLERFEKSRGYSLTKYIPLLYTASNQFSGLPPPYMETYVYGNYTSDGTSIYSLDYMTVLNEAYQEYIEHFKLWAHSNGLQYSNQPAYNLPLQMLSDVPLLDAPETESLGFLDLVDAYRQFSGPANLYNVNVISSEVGAVSTVSFSQTVPDLLFRIKRSWAGGITQMVIHGADYSGDYVNTTWPGYQSFGFRYTEMWSVLQPCWRHISDAMDYIGRTQLVLRKGVPKRDLAFYLYESPYVPASQYQSDNLQSLGYTYDYLGPDNLLADPASVEHQLLAADGPAYKTLIFSNQSVISPKVAARVLSFAEAGLPVFFIGPPANWTSSASDAATWQTNNPIQQLSATTTNIHHLESVEALPEALLAAGITPRVQLSCSTNPVYTVWRSDPAEGKDYIFIYNDQPVPVRCEANFTTEPNVVPHILDAWTGKQAPLFSYHRTSDTVLSFNLTLVGNETQIITLIQDSDKRNHILQMTDNVTLLPSTDPSHVSVVITGPANITSSTGKTSVFHPSLPPPTYLENWNLTIQDWHGPTSPDEKFSVKTEITTYQLLNISLAPWNSLGSEYANVSGVGIYKTTFSTPQPSSPSRLGAYISFPRVQHTLRASVNGHRLGPLDPVNPVADITPYLRRAADGNLNELVVEVTTTLLNRVKSEAGSLLFVGAPIISTQPLYANFPSQEYGLLGPVVVTWAETTETEL